MSIFGGGSSSSSSTTTQAPTDPEAARRMAAVAERQQAMAEEQWGIGKEIYMPYERKMVESNVGLIAPNQALMEARLKEGTYDIAQDRTRRDLIRSQLTDELRASADVPGKFYDETDIDIGDRMAKAQADVEQAYGGVEGEWRRSAGRMGIAPDSGRFASIRGKMLGQKAGDVAGARTTARRTGLDDRWARLGTAMQLRAGAQRGSLDIAPYQQGDLQLGGYQMTNPLERSAGLYGNVVRAHEAGMRPLTQSQSSNRSWNFNISAERYKENIEPLKVDVIDAMNAVTFKYIDKFNDPNKHIGFIAEELIEIVPEAVVVNERGFAEGINYNELIPILVNELQSLRKRVKELEG